MIIDYLGHSEFLVRIKNSSGEEVKILCDSWVSDYVVGDMLGRNPQIEMDYKKLGYIDAVFISHAHTDHLDPYTLVDIFSKLETKPILILPETLSFLSSLFEQYLEIEKIIILKNKNVVEVNGIKLRGYIFANTDITNEDDVMSLFISNDKEIVYTEVDSVPPETDENWEYIYRILTEKKYETVLYLATRNELEGNIQLLDIDNIGKRKEFVKEYTQKRKDEIEYEYVKFTENYVDYPDITRIHGFMRIYIGQGICFPLEINRDLMKLRLMPLEENIKYDMLLSRQYGKKFFIGYFTPGKSYSIEHSRIIGESNVSYLNVVNYENPQIDIQYTFERKLFDAPVNDEIRDIDEQKEIILDLLNARFLPYWLAMSPDNLKNSMLKNGRYCIKIKFGTKQDFKEVQFVTDFSNFHFVEQKEVNTSFDELYWANDIHDFYLGTQELYSNFHHKLVSGKGYRFWTCLGANFLNNDLVYKKFEYHFQQAKKGKSARDFVLPVYEKLLGKKFL